MLEPGLFAAVEHAVRVETQGYAAGQVIVDRRDKHYAGVKTEICVGVDAPGLLQLYQERLTA